MVRRWICSGNHPYGEYQARTIAFSARPGFLTRPSVLVCMGVHCVSFSYSCIGWNIPCMAYSRSGQRVKKSATLHICERYDILQRGVDACCMIEYDFISLYVDRFQDYWARVWHKCGNPQPFILLRIMFLSCLKSLCFSNMKVMNVSNY